MSALDEISTLLESMRSRKEELTKFEGLLSEISVALGDIVTAMERPGEHQSIADAITEGFRTFAIAPPEVHVNVPAAPDVNVTVQPAQVIVMPAENQQVIKGWKLQVTQKFDNGSIREISLTPEV